MGDKKLVWNFSRKTYRKKVTWEASS